jgi:hypothetical protein
LARLVRSCKSASHSFASFAARMLVGMLVVVLVGMLVAVLVGMLVVVLVLMLVVVLVAMLVVVVSERHIVQDSLIFIDTEKRRDVILSLAAAFFPLLI